MKINELSKELRVDVGIDSKFANYDLVSLEKLDKHFNKIINEQSNSTV